MHFCAGVFNTQLDADLAQAGWDGSLVPYPGETLRNFTLSHLRRSVLKKFVQNSTGTTRAGDEAALKKFLASNERCKEWVARPDLLNEAETEIVGEVKSLIYEIFNPNGLPLLTMGEIAQGFSFGPGANLGAKGQDFYTKLSCSTLSSTSEHLFQMYRCSVRCHPLWAAQEDLRHQVRGHEIVSGNRLSFVPKYADISRVICTEPLLNMMFQKGVERLMLRRLHQVFGINLESQQVINRRLARVGARTGSFATIDLESASDSISVSLCKELLPPEVMRWLLLIRSPVTRIPGDKQDTVLHMISSMGNATTFPLQTIFFSAITLAVYKVLGLRVKKRSKVHRFTTGFAYYRDYTRSLPNFAVNGDDIICDTRAFRLVVRMLEYFGFVINKEKSFSDGRFRESCGADFYGSTNVRGVYIKRLNDVCDFNSAINRLNWWSVQHTIPLPRTIQYLLSCIRRQDRRWVPFHESPDSGIKVPVSLARPRYDRNHSFIYKFWRVKDKRVVLQTPKGVDLQQAAIRRALPQYYLNPAGLYNALLAGGIRARSILQRQNRRDLELRTRHTPCWEWSDPAVRVSARHREEWYYLTPLNLGLQEV